VDASPILSGQKEAAKGLIMLISQMENDLLWGVDVDVETDYLSLSQTYTWDNEIKWVLARKGVEFQVDEQEDETLQFNIQRFNNYRDEGLCIW